MKAARKAFNTFPAKAQVRIAMAMTIAAAGHKADIAKSMKGLGSGVFEIALPYRSDAFRVVYTVQIDEAIWGWFIRSRRNPRPGLKPQNRRLI